MGLLLLSIVGPLRKRVQMKQQWFSIRTVATVIGYEPVPLRRLIERHARKGPDGTIEAVVDGLRARKLGRTWRVQLGERWLAGGAP